METTTVKPQQTYPSLCCEWILKHIQFVVQDLFHNEESSFPISDQQMPETSSKREVDNDVVSSDDSGTKQELENMRKEIERLLNENCKLREELSRLKEQCDNASQSQTQSGLWQFDDVVC